MDNLVFKVFIPKKVESLNNYIYYKYHKYKKYRDSWYNNIWAEIGRCVDKDVPKRHLTIISIRTRFLADDNFAGGCKPIPDALEKLGWIVNDDNTKYFVCDRHQHKPDKANKCGTWLILRNY